MAIGHQYQSPLSKILLRPIAKANGKKLPVGKIKEVKAKQMIPLGEEEFNDF